MKKYRTGGYGELIEEIEIVKETDRCIFFRQDYFGKMREIRQAKRSSSTNYWNTIKEAKEFLKERATISIKNYKESIERLETRLIKIEKFKLLTKK